MVVSKNGENYTLKVTTKEQADVLKKYCKCVYKCGNTFAATVSKELKERILKCLK